MNLEKVLKRMHLMILLLLLQGCYSLNQASHFGKLFLSRKDITEVIKTESVSSLEKERLKKVLSIVAFAAGQGLNTDGAYTTYIRTEKRAVSWLVQSAHPLNLKLDTWWFPIVGSVPYLGYFDKRDRDSKARELRRKGKDVHIATVGAFSSLGWFADPIYTPMLMRSDSRLARLFFHELVHRTFWSSGSVRFNENLAEHLSHVMWLRYIKDETNREKILSDYYKIKSDRRLFKDWLRQMQKELKILYRRKDFSNEEKISKKQEIIEVFQTDRLPEFQTEKFLYIEKRKWNNASIAAVSLYLPDTSRFDQAFKCFGEEGSVGDFLKDLAHAEEQFETPFLALDSFCKAESLSR